MLAEAIEVPAQAIELPGWAFSIGSAFLGAVLTWLMNRTIKSLDEKLGKLEKAIGDLETDTKDIALQLAEMKGREAIAHEK